MQIWESANKFIVIWKQYVQDFTLKTPSTFWDMSTWDMWHSKQ